MTELHERLQGKIDDPALAEGSLGHMGTAYNRMGRFPDAIRCHESALKISRTRSSLQAEATWLLELGNDSGDFCDQAKSREYYESALAINRQIGDRDGEATCLGNLGTHYDDIGQTALAMQTMRRPVRSITISNPYRERPVALSTSAIVAANSVNRRRRWKPLSRR